MSPETRALLAIAACVLVPWAIACGIYATRYF